MPRGRRLQWSRPLGGPWEGSRSRRLRSRHSRNVAGHTPRSTARGFKSLPPLSSSSTALSVIISFGHVGSPCSIPSTPTCPSRTGQPLSSALFSFFIHLPRFRLIRLFRGSISSRPIRVIRAIRGEVSLDCGPRSHFPTFSLSHFQTAPQCNNPPFIYRDCQKPRGPEHVYTHRFHNLLRPVPVRRPDRRRRCTRIPAHPPRPQTLPLCQNTARQLHGHPAQRQGVPRQTGNAVLPILPWNQRL
jgi:hypothetical protein